MNTFTKNLLLFLLLSSTFILPACGNNEVKSQKVPATVLKSNIQTTAPPMIVMTATPLVTATQTPSVAAALSTTHTYAKKVTVIKHHVKSHVVPMMAAAIPLVTPVSASAFENITTNNEMVQKKSSSHWPLIIAAIALVAALGFYFWTKKTPPHNDFPLPPMGGLSPVGGFTGMQNKVQSEIKKQSIWTKKIL